jgi:hypothetical protein
MDDPGRGQRISLHQPQELLPSDLALPRSPRQPFPPEPPCLVDDGGQALIVAADAKVSEVPLEHLADLLTTQPPKSRGNFSLGGEFLHKLLQVQRRHGDIGRAQSIGFAPNPPRELFEIHDAHQERLVTILYPLAVHAAAPTPISLS